MVGKTKEIELVYERSDLQVAVLMPPNPPDRKVIWIRSTMEDRVICVECRTTRTPMWRSGPTGPRSLCNACGIRYRKKRRQEKLGVLQKIAVVDQKNNSDIIINNNPNKNNADAPDELKNLEAVKKRRVVVMGVDEDIEAVDQENSHKNSISDASDELKNLEVVKKRRVLVMGVDEDEDIEAVGQENSDNKNNNNNADGPDELKNLEVVKKRRVVVMGVEEAAVLLMALSSDPACFAISSDGDIIR